MSTIDEGVVVTGDIFGDTDLTIKGVVKGSIFLQKGSLTVDQSGYMEGEVLADRIVLAGELVGNVTAITSLHLMSTTKMVGNIQTTKIAMADGAFFSGNLEVREPEPVELGIQDFKAMTEEDYEKLRRWRVRNKIE